MRTRVRLLVLLAMAVPTEAFAQTPGSGPIADSVAAPSAPAEPPSTPASAPPAPRRSAPTRTSPRAHVPGYAEMVRRWHTAPAGPTVKSPDRAPLVIEVLNT